MSFVKTSQQNEIVEPFRVFLRIRPINDKEEVAQNNYLQKVDNNTYFGLSKEDSQMKFDYIFSEDDSNITIYQKSLSPSLVNVMRGFNTTVLCYGMTGAGKTYTMFGSLQKNNTDSQGLIYQAVQELFDIVFQVPKEQYQIGIRVSFIEIYNETIKDLLAETDQLNIHEDPVKGIFIPGLQETSIKNLKELHDLILLGQQRRTFASTCNNVVSSRSHAIVQIIVQTKNNETKEITEGKLTLVDLAGSERTQPYYASSFNSSNHYSPQRRQMEGQNINRSLLALGQCITQLQEHNGQTKYIPYRNSKLTRLLKQSLGGNALTFFIACVSKSIQQIEETENTLRYAQQAKKLKSHLRVQKRKATENNQIVNVLCSSNKASFISISTVKNDEYDLSKLKTEKSNITTDRMTDSLNINKIFDDILQLAEQQQQYYQNQIDLQQDISRFQDILTKKQLSLKTRYNSREYQSKVLNFNELFKIQKDIEVLESQISNFNQMLKEININIEQNQKEIELMRTKIVKLFSENQIKSEGQLKLLYDFVNKNSNLPPQEDKEKIKEITNQYQQLYQEVQDLKEKIIKKDQIIDEFMSTQSRNSLQRSELPIRHYRQKSTGNFNSLLTTQRYLTAAGSKDTTLISASQRPSYREFINIFDKFNQEENTSSFYLRLDKNPPLHEESFNINDENPIQPKYHLPKSLSISNPFSKTISSDKDQIKEYQTKQFSVRIDNIWMRISQKENRSQLMRESADLVIEYLKKKPILPQQQNQRFQQLFKIFPQLNSYLPSQYFSQR